MTVGARWRRRIASVDDAGECGRAIRAVRCRAQAQLLDILQQELVEIPAFLINVKESGDVQVGRDVGVAVASRFGTTVGPHRRFLLCPAFRPLTSGVCENVELEGRNTPLTASTVVDLSSDLYPRSGSGPASGQ